MQFGVDKCAYIKMSGGKQFNSQAPLKINDVVIQPVEEGDTYRYLGQYENIEYIGQLNKERVRKELYTRCRQLWSSELSAYDKATAHHIKNFTSQDTKAEGVWSQYRPYLNAG